MEAANDEIQSILGELDNLFEPSPTLHVILLRDEARLLSESHAGRATEDMIGYVRSVLLGLVGRKELDEILNAHPRLGETRIDSAHSRAEQRTLSNSKSGDTGEGERERLMALNERYEKTFPGLRYVVFVNGRPRGEIMRDMLRRIERDDIHLERREAVDAMHDIAKDRLSKMSIAASP